MCLNAYNCFKIALLTSILGQAKPSQVFKNVASVGHLMSTHFLQALCFLQLMVFISKTTQWDYSKISWDAFALYITVASKYFRCWGSGCDAPFPDHDRSNFISNQIKIHFKLNYCFARYQGEARKAW